MKYLGARGNQGSRGGGLTRPQFTQLCRVPLGLDQYGRRVGWRGGAEAPPPDCLAPAAGTQDY